MGPLRSSKPTEVLYLLTSTSKTAAPCAVQALRELQPLLQSPQVGLAAKAALIHASGVAEDHDKDVAVRNMATELDVSRVFSLSPSPLTSCYQSDRTLMILKTAVCLIQEQSVAAPPSALLQLAAFLWHTGSQERARACAERVLQQAPNDVASLALLGWILARPHSEVDAHSVEPEDLDQAMGLFEQALSMQPRHTEVALGIEFLCTLNVSRCPGLEHLLMCYVGSLSQAWC